LLIAASAFAGLLIGSFINVVSYRVPLAVKVTSPPSACPACGHQIRPRDNIPIVSWLALRGRCRDCGERISARYPIVEAGTAVTFGLTAWLIGASWTLPAYLWFAGVAVALTVTDLDHKRIPNRILYPGTIVGTALLAGGAALDMELPSMGRALLGATAAFAFFLIVGLAARGGFGFGDVKLAFLLGEFSAYRSWDALMSGVFSAFLVGGLAAVAMLLAGRAGRKDAIPFGPALILGAAIGIAWGEDLVSWYLG
jgi:leader peptidase (prepilin peptidase)/N-methyltransferase